jgi:hypothetical protein
MANYFDLIGQYEVTCYRREKTFTQDIVLNTQQTDHEAHSSTINSRFQHLKINTRLWQTAG